jgi:hypothetical protein
MALGGSTGSKVTPYLIYLVFITTLGALQFGYHLVFHLMPASMGLVSSPLTVYYNRLSSMPLRLL